MTDDYRRLWQLLPWGDNRVPNIPKKIVIHCMGEYLDVGPDLATQYKTQPGIYHASMWLNITKLSAHALISPTGVIIRHRKDNEVAWHAKGHNYDTLGVEFLVKGVWTWGPWAERIKTPYLEPAQFDAGQEQVSEWIKQWNIHEITTHHALDPDRRPDPGDGFPFAEFHQML